MHGRPLASNKRGISSCVVAAEGTQRWPGQAALAGVRFRMLMTPPRPGLPAPEITLGCPLGRWSLHFPCVLRTPGPSLDAKPHALDPVYASCRR